MANKGVLKYRKYQRINSHDPEAAPMWYAKAAPDRTVEFEGLVTHMSEHNSPYSRGVINGVLTDMLDCVKELVLDGKNVRLGDLGLFSVGITSKGALTSDKWSVASHVKGVHLVVRNTKKWSNTELRNSCTLQEMKEYSVEEGESSSAGDEGSEEAA